MKYSLILFIAALALVLSVDAQSRARTAQTGDTAWEQGVERFDGYLQEGLSQGTHDTIAHQVHDSAEWVEGVGDNLVRIGE